MSSARASEDGSTPPEPPVDPVRPQTLRLLEGLWILTFLALGVSLSRSVAHDRAVSRHDTYIHDLRALPAADATLNACVLQARGGLLARYDPIVHAVSQLDQLHAALLHVPAEISRVGRNELVARVQASLELLQQKEARVEQFKTENAIVRNSSRFLPVAAGEFAESASHRPDGAPLATAVQGLSSAAMRFLILGDDTWRDLVAADVSSLRAARDALATRQELPVLDGILLHAQVLHDHKPRLDALVRTIVTMPTRQRAQSIEAAYVTHHDAAVARATAWRLSLALEALALLLLSTAHGVLQRRRSVHVSRTPSEGAPDAPEEAQPTA